MLCLFMNAESSLIYPYKIPSRHYDQHLLFCNALLWQCVLPSPLSTWVTEAVTGKGNLVPSLTFLTLCWLFWLQGVHSAQALNTQEPALLSVGFSFLGFFLLSFLFLIVLSFCFSPLHFLDITFSLGHPPSLSPCTRGNTGSRVPDSCH